MPENPQTHPIPIGDDAELGVTQELTIPTIVKKYKFNEVDQSYHYHLETVFEAPNTSAATVQIGDVSASLIILRTE